MYQTAAFLHIVTAATWLGGLVFVGLVLFPLTRRMQQPPGAGSLLLQAATHRFRPFAWGSLVMLVVTGVWLLGERHVSAHDLFTAEGTFYVTLRIKVALVAILLPLTALHDFVLGPRIGRKVRALAGDPAGLRSIARERMIVSWLARLDFLLTLAIFALGVVLVRGNPF